MAKLIWVYEFPFPEPGPQTFYMTCINHQTARYSTKNPFQRNIHVLAFPEGFGSKECDCPFSEMVVIVNVEEAAK